MPRVAAGWQAQRVAGGTALSGANGIRFGADGRIYVAQVVGSQLSVVDPANGAITTLSSRGGPIESPDDLAFTSDGTMLLTEVEAGRVAARAPNGETRILAADLPAANGITVHRDRIFVDEFRPGGRLLELFSDGRAPRVIAADLPMPNALSVGPDDHIYFPTVMRDEIWRVPIAGGTPECFASGISRPVAVKFRSDGHLVAVASGTGEVSEIDVTSGERRLLGRTQPGIDNFDFAADGSVIVSHFIDGSLARLTPSGEVEELLPGAMLGPWAMTVLPSGEVIIADGLSIARIGTDGLRREAILLRDAGYPGLVTAIAVSPDGTWHIGTGRGGIFRRRCGASIEPAGPALSAPAFGMVAMGRDAVAVCDAGSGCLLELRDGQSRVIADHLGRPIGLAAGADGNFFVTDVLGGRVLHVTAHGASPVATGLMAPEGIAQIAGTLVVVDRGSASLLAIDPATHAVDIVATDLPLSATRRASDPLEPIGMDGPLTTRFADIVVDAAGGILVGCDGDHSIWRFARV